jgi:L-asparaginase / beta-aspartyl-peptidase
MVTRPIIAIPGGAGALQRASMTPERDAAARAGLLTALAVGRGLLARGGSALDAVDAAVRVLEDDPSFNAGRGAALTRDGRAEHDAAIMEGASERAGAVAGVTVLRNPVEAARLVMERGPHVLLIGPGAERFAIDLGASTVDPAWFITERARGDLAVSASGGGSASRGTVGAVALDRDGRLAAATSTGGITGKLPGRVGDSPLIGAGTYANGVCAVSATGHGESFIRAVFAYRVAVSIAAGEHPSAAADAALRHVDGLGGSGGCIVLDRSGRAALRHTTAGMFRGVADEAGERVAIYGDEG